MENLTSDLNSRGMSVANKSGPQTIVDDFDSDDDYDDVSETISVAPSSRPKRALKHTSSMGTSEPTERAKPEEIKIDVKIHKKHDPDL